MDTLLRSTKRSSSGHPWGTYEDFTSTVPVKVAKKIEEAKAGGPLAGPG